MELDIFKTPEWIHRVDGTLKFSIEFADYNRIGETWIHPFLVSSTKDDEMTGLTCHSQIPLDIYNSHSDYINDNYILPDNISRVMNVSGSSTYKFDTSCELDTTRKLIKKTADNNFNLLDVTSSNYVVEDKVFYAVELEGDDIFYSDDLLVHS